MAVPAILGLNWLASVLGGALSSMIGFFMLYVSKKIAIGIVLVTAFVAMSAAFVGSIEAMTAAIVWTFPLTANIGLFLPADISATMGVYLAARTAWWLFWTNWAILTHRIII